MAQYFPHEQLDVYGVALRFAELADGLLASWQSSWAVHDQFDRATESIVVNLAKAARLRATDAGIYCLECSLGSVLECAACLDVAYCRHLVDGAQVQTAKEILQQIARMEVGLRASWGGSVREEAEGCGAAPETHFLHESLNVYQRSLQVHESLDAIWQDDGARSRRAKRIDDFSTSLTINIAEGNGRFSKVDHSKFLGIAEDAGTKLAAYLDLIEPTPRLDIDQTKSHLREVMSMLSGLRGYLKE